jgi:hypothetical protein
VEPIETLLTSFRQQRTHLQSSFDTRNNKRQGRMTVPTTPHVMAASPLFATSPTSLSDDANDDEEEEAPVLLSNH